MSDLDSQNFRVVASEIISNPGEVSALANALGKVQQQNNPSASTDKIGNVVQAAELLSALENMQGNSGSNGYGSNSGYGDNGFGSNGNGYGNSGYGSGSGSELNNLFNSMLSGENQGYTNNNNNFGNNGNGYDGNGYGQNNNGLNTNEQALFNALTSQSNNNGTDPNYGGNGFTNNNNNYGSNYNNSGGNGYGGGCDNGNGFGNGYNSGNGFGNGYNNGGNYGHGGSSNSQYLRELDSLLADLENDDGSNGETNNNNNGGDHCNTGSNGSSGSNGNAGNCGSGNGNSVKSTSNSDIKSWGDPHIDSNVDGTASKSTMSTANNPNLESIKNTVGGATQIGTKETAVTNGVDYNKEVDYNHGGDNKWSAQVLHNDDGSMGVNLHDSNGYHMLGNGQSFTEADGSKITNNGSNATVSQQLSSGGTVSSTVTNNGSGLDVDTKTTGAARLGGSAVNNSASA